MMSDATESRFAQKLNLFRSSRFCTRVFRSTLPNAPRPQKTLLYPLTLRLFIVAGGGIVVNTFIADRMNAVIGAVIITVGAPVYFLWKKFA